MITQTGPVYVMVTGSRSWVEDYDGTVTTALGDAIRTLTPYLHASQQLVLLAGGARGLDKLACLIWRETFHLGIKEVTPDWSGPCGDRCPAGHRLANRFGAEYCPGAGFYRNTRMVEMRPRLVLAFFRACGKPTCPKRGNHDSHGTTQAMEEAQAAGVTVWSYHA